MPIIELENLIREKFGISAKDYFNYLRLQYLRKELSKNPHLRPYLRRVLRKEPEETIPVSDLDAGVEDDWDNVNFHLENRVSAADELGVIEGVDKDAVERVLEEGYSLSILPLNIAIGDRDLMQKFIPKEDFFAEHAVKSINPYGVFDKGVIVERNGVHIGSQKFSKSLLMNITKLCFSGCVGCYKGEYTRVKGSRFFTDLEKAASVQSEELVGYLNENPETDCVIMSGGEPLLLSNDGMEKVLTRLKDAEYLTEFRICTGTIFQGLPYRIDDDLLEILKDFENGSGIQVHFNAHLSHPSQFTTDALIAVRRIKDRGFYVNTQVPLQRGVNVFLDDKEKTMDLLKEMTRLYGASGIRPYKDILHMNCGSLEYSVPLEYMRELLGELKCRTDHPNSETRMPVSMPVLCREGNIILSPQMLLCMYKRVDSENDYVEYRIPVPDNGFRQAVYREPLIPGHNDDPDSLVKVRNEWMSLAD